MQNKFWSFVFYILIAALVITGLVVLVVLLSKSSLGKKAIAKVMAYNRQPKGSNPLMVHYTIKLVGVNCSRETQALIAGLEKGSTLTYKPVEGHIGSDGKSYPNAVAVLHKETILGWIPDATGPYRSSMAKQFRDKIRKGKAPVIEGWTNPSGGTPKTWGLHINVCNPK